MLGLLDFLSTITTILAAADTLPAVDPSVNLTTLTPASIAQWIAILSAIGGAGWAIKERRRSAKMGQLTVEKTALEQLVEENKLLISKLKLLRKDQDKWYLLRLTVLGMANGAEIIKQVEKSVDEISSDE
jgi:hypothetical protein